MYFLDGLQMSHLTKKGSNMDRMVAFLFIMFGVLACIFFQLYIDPFIKLIYNSIKTKYTLKNKQIANQIDDIENKQIAKNSEFRVNGIENYDQNFTPIDTNDKIDYDTSEIDDDEIIYCDFIDPETNEVIKKKVKWKDIQQMMDDGLIEYQEFYDVYNENINEDDYEDDGNEEE